MALTYYSPASLDEAFDVLHNCDVSVIAGGTDWFPGRADKPNTQSILDITGLPEFRGVTPNGGGWRIGAATTWSALLRAALPACFDGLKAAAKEVGSVQIQNAATVAGNLCNASPAADGVPPLLSLGAEVELVSKSGRRVVPLAEFITGVRQTALRQGELVAGLLIPQLPENTRSSFLKIGARRYLVISIAMVAVVLTLENGKITDARVAVGACSPVAQRLGGLENALIGRSSTDFAQVVSGKHLAPLSPISDLRASAQYRHEAVVETCVRAIAMAFGAKAKRDG